MKITIIGALKALILCAVLFVVCFSCLIVFRRYHQKSVEARLEARGISVFEMSTMNPTIRRLVGRGVFTDATEVTFRHGINGECLVDDALVSDLCKLNRLTFLDLSNSHIQPGVLKKLYSAPDIEILRLTNTDVSDDDLAGIGSLKSLKSLDISMSPVTNLGLRHIANVAQIERLAADGTSIDDAGLRVLYGLPKLKAITINSTKVSDVGYKNLVLNLSSHQDRRYMVSPVGGDPIGYIQVGP